MQPEAIHRLLKGPFFEAARTGNHRWWRVILTLVFVFASLTVATALLVTPLLMVYPSTDLLNRAPLPLALTAALAPFGAAWLALGYALPVFHRRPFRSLLLPGGAFRWRLFFVSGGLWALLAAAVDGVQAMLGAGDYRWSFEARHFWPYLGAALVWMPVQTSAEELIFRGYLTQVFGARARRIGWPLLAPALIFALLHLPNPEVSALGWWSALPQYFLMGVLLGWVTLNSQGLEMAFGLHLANNLYTGLVAGLRDSALPSASLFIIEELNPMVNLVLIGIAGVVYLLLAGRLARRFRWTAAAALLLVLTACAPTVTPAPPENGSSLRLEDCLLSAPGQPVQVVARCGQLEVPENPADPNGRTIRLNVAVVKAQSSNPAPDPLFMLAGGPGQAASEAFLPMLPLLERVTFKRDVVLVDQRGTGKSNPLHCESAVESEPLGGRLPYADEVYRQMTHCVQEELRGDPRFYTTEIAMQDLEAVRKALGYGQVNLLGVSYGTRAALTYMRLYPQNVRTAILDGVVPPGWAIGQSLRRDAQRALDLIFTRCAGDPACREAFPNLSEEWKQLLQRLRQTPAEVSVPHPTTGEATAISLSAETVGMMVRLISYSSDYAALLPWLIHTAAQGDLQPLAAQYLLALKGNDTLIEEGLFFAVLCSEDVPLLPPEGEPGEYFFYDVSETWRAACRAYPSNPQARAGEAFPVLKIPTLLISGEADPVTPPENAEAARQYLPDSLHVVLPGMGHGNFYVGCVPGLVRQLIEKASVEGMDSGCVARTTPLPFFISSLGPQP
uniref:Alpha/beta fold hydrolase n=1 Tax=Anaerolinea thermolimosa TaxID=229919 RepID=A0A7C4KGF5_9CHLR